MLKLLTAPLTNDRSPRYMERALAAIHQAQRHAESITFLYAATQGRVGLFIEFQDHLEELVTGPIAANYPNCTVATVEQFDEAPPGMAELVSRVEIDARNFSDSAPRPIRGLAQRHLCRSDQRHLAGGQAE